MSPQEVASELETQAGWSIDYVREQAYAHAAKLVRDHLILRWTKQHPAKDGVYWYRENNAFAATLAHVNGAFAAHLGVNGSNGYTPNWKTVEWSDFPIVEPE